MVYDVVCTVCCLEFSGIITDEQITVSTYESVYTKLMARGNSNSGWTPARSDYEPWLLIDLGQVSHQPSYTID